MKAAEATIKTSAETITPESPHDISLQIFQQTSGDYCCLIIFKLLDRQDYGSTLVLTALPTRFPLSE